MFVIVDMEWISIQPGQCSVTQLAAVRVNENWEALDKFHALIKPRDIHCHQWNHMAYTGCYPSDFYDAKNAYSVFEEFQTWLLAEDVLLWWHNDSEILFKKLVSVLLKTIEPHGSLSIGKYVRAFFAEKAKCSGDFYRIASSQGIQTLPILKHNAQNDVRVLQALLEHISYPQENLRQSHKKKQKEKQKELTNDKNLPFQLDLKTHIIHTKNCPEIKQGETRGYKTLKTPLEKKYQPCDCCKKEYNAAIREKNESTLHRVQYTYIYSEHSNIFHKHTCKSMLSAKSILGCRNYNKVVATGRIPCKICNPTAYDEQKALPLPAKTKRIEKAPKNVLKKEDAKAIKRQKVAVEERARKLQDITLSTEEKNDVYTLTQPRFAFWVGQGCRTFHLHSCSKLHDTTHLQGFATYQEAIRAGFKPCRKCKPNMKHNAVLSVPITNRIREKESVEDLEALCQNAGFSYKKDDLYFCLETIVGKWKIHTTSIPVKLEHINLAKNPFTTTYHKQPRIFLSLTDTFAYIKRHDENLTRQRMMFSS